MYVLARGPATAATGKGRPKLAQLSGVQQLLSPQHDLVAHQEGRVHSDPVHRRLGFLLHLLLQGLHPSRPPVAWLLGSPQVWEKAGGRNADFNQCRTGSGRSPA